MINLIVTIITLKYVGYTDFNRNKCIESINSQQNSLCSLFHIFPQGWLKQHYDVRHCVEYISLAFVLWLANKGGNWSTCKCSLHAIYKGSLAILRLNVTSCKQYYQIDMIILIRAGQYDYSMYRE